jgi:hypothetical protein
MVSAFAGSVRHWAGNVIQASKDGVPRGDDWRVLNCHLRFLQPLRAEARKVAGVYA